MTQAWHRPLRRPMTIVVCLIATAGALTGSLAAPASPQPRGTVRVLQMNLCDSGIAECYTGRAVAEADAVIRAGAPDVVTLNEVCESDVSALQRTLAAAQYGGTVVSAFQPATDRRTSRPFRCLNGQPYGIGLLVHLPAPVRGYTTYRGTYPTQDASDPEERVWVCVYAIGSFYACTTHLANTSPTVALAQCRYLWGTVLPSLRADAGGADPTVLGGDLNLGYGSLPDVGSCLPSDYLRGGDGGVQFVVATADFSVLSRRSIGMGGTTDHPGLLVALTRRRASPATR